MAEIPVTNDGKNPLPVGNYMIPPGETRHIEERLVPAYLRPAPAGEQPVAEPVDALLAILDDSIKNIVPQLADLADDELDRLEAAEKAGKTRDGMLKAFAEERLRRAAEDEAAADMDAFVAGLQAMTDDEVLEQADVFAADEGRLALVQTEIDRRAEANAANG